MGCVYRRHQSLWLKYQDTDGCWRYQASGFKVGDERKAEALLLRIENLVESGEDVAKDGPMTVERWSQLWLESRRAKGVVVVDDYESRLKNHILPHIGALRLREWRRSLISAADRSRRARSFAGVDTRRPSARKAGRAVADQGWVVKD